MGRVYSTQFLLAGLAGGESITYTVPDGYVAVVRDVTGTLNGAGTDFLGVGVEGVFAIIDHGDGDVDGYTTIQWSGRMVLTAGQELQVVGTAAWTAVVSGYLLVAP